MELSVPIGFVVFSWILLIMPIWIFNLSLMNEQSKNRILNILQEGICLNPFNRILYKHTPILLIRTFGIIIAALYLSIFHDLLQYRFLSDASYNPLDILIILAVNFFLQFWLLYFLYRIKIAFDKEQIRPGLFLAPRDLRNNVHTANFLI